ncbi:MAG: HNH endonuclease [Chitinophagaceae bacterium]
MEELILKYIYETCSNVEEGVEFGAPLDLTRPNINVARTKATSFQRETLLHLFIQQAFILSSDHLFYNMTEAVSEGSLQLDFYEDQFYSYNIDIDFLRIKFDESDNTLTTKKQVLTWYKKNREKFNLLAQKICPEVFHILFSNKTLLHKFNENIALDFTNFNFSVNELNSKGKLRRKSIPVWVKRAVFHRDKGVCSFCTIDLTYVFNIFPTENYDHIVPLDLYGVNDPTNIQLLCKKCNLDKLNRTSQVGKKYQLWF